MLHNRITDGIFYDMLGMIIFILSNVGFRFSIWQFVKLKYKIVKKYIFGFHFQKKFLGFKCNRLIMSMTHG